MAHNIDIERALGKAGTRGFDVHTNSTIETLIGADPFTKHANHVKELAHFEDIGDGRFTNSSSGRNTLLNQMRSHIENHEDMQNILNEINVEGVGKSSKLDRMSNKTVEQLKKNANRFYTAADKLEQKHTKGIKLLAEARTEAMKDLSEKYFAAREALTNLDVSKGGKHVDVLGGKVHVSNEAGKKALLEDLEKNFEKASDQIGKLYDKKLDAHKETLSELKSLVGEVQTKTGVAKGASTAAKEGGAMGRMVDSAVKEAEEVGKVSGGASLAIVGGTTALGAVAGHALLDRGEDAGHTGTIGGGIAGLVVGLAAKSKIAQWLNLASHARA